MDKRIHFLSGLPRSGSTLLGAILNQNPKLRGGMSSPVGSLVGRMRDAMGPRNEFAGMITDSQRRDILRGVVAGFYRDDRDKEAVIDNHRAWCARLPLIDRLYPEAKVIVCVRDLAWVLDSFERVLRRSPLRTSKLFAPKDALTVQSRVNALMAPGGAVGFAWNATLEAFYGEQAERLIVVDYEALAREPRRTLDAVYAKLGLAPFAHDFDNVVYDGGEAFDAQIGMPGLHAVKRVVRLDERATVLPPDLVQRFSGHMYWRRPEANPRGVEVVLPSC